MAKGRQRGKKTLVKRFRQAAKRVAALRGIWEGRTEDHASLEAVNKTVSFSVDTSIITSVALPSVAEGPRPAYVNIRGAHGLLHRVLAR